MSQIRVETLEQKHTHILKECGIVLFASILIALSGKLSIPLLFSPVPLVFQMNVIFILPFLLGFQRAAISIVAWMLYGIYGLPVFALSGATLAYLFGPTGGYVIGYLVAVLLMKKRILYQKRTPFSLFQTFMIGNGIVYLIGAGYLSCFIGIKQAMLVGILPFVLGDLVKNFVAAKFLAHRPKNLPC